MVQPVAGLGHGGSAEHETDLHQLLVQSVVDYAIFLLTPEGHVASWNLGAERLKGYRRDEIVGRHFSCFYTGDDRAADVPGDVLRAAAEQGRCEREGWRLRKDGSSFWADVVITALRGADGELRGFAKVTRDLTDRKRNEDALHAAVARERDAAARLRDLDRLRTELVTVIAHDLREPVSVIAGFVDLLRSDWATIGDDEKLDVLTRLSARAESLGTMVDEVFDLARIEAGELRVEAAPFDLRAVVDGIAGDIRVAFPGHPVVVTGDGEAWALGDEHRTTRALTNLVTNACKFSPNATPVAIDACVRGDLVAVTVTDRGEGIPQEQQALLFQRFTRLPQSEGTAGSGFGLYIVKSLVEAQGGRVWVESSPGAGSTFGFELPVAPTTR